MPEDLGWRSLEVEGVKLFRRLGVGELGQLEDGGFDSKVKAWVSG